MKWLRLYNETVHDPKWRMIAIEAEQPVHAVLAVWMVMLCHASGAEPRGTLDGWNDRLAAAALDLKSEVVNAIRTAMQGVVLDGDRLTAWDKRQFKTDDVNDRSKRHRAKKAGHDPDSDVAATEEPPPCDDAATLHTPHATLQTPDATLPPLRATDLRLQITERDPAADARARLAEVGMRVLSLIGVADDPRWFGSYGRVQQWLADGANPDLDIYPTVQRVMIRRGAQGPPGGLEYFDRPIADAIATRNRPMPEGKPHAHSDQRPRRETTTETTARRRAGMADALARRMGSP